MSVTPATLVIGALGAGKTRWINQQLAARAAGQPVAVLLNELGATALAAGPDVYVQTSLGCACCTGAVVFDLALVRVLRHIRRHAPVHPPDRGWRLIIEADSRADPARIAAQLSAPQLAAHLRLERTVQLP